LSPVFIIRNVNYWLYFLKKARKPLSFAGLFYKKFIPVIIVGEYLIKDVKDKI